MVIGCVCDRLVPLNRLSWMFVTAKSSDLILYASLLAHYESKLFVLLEFSFSSLGVMSFCCYLFLEEWYKRLYVYF